MEVASICAVLGLPAAVDTSDGDLFGAVAVAVGSDNEWLNTGCVGRRMRLGRAGAVGSGPDITGRDGERSLWFEDEGCSFWSKEGGGGPLGSWDSSIGLEEDSDDWEANVDSLKSGAGNNGMGFRLGDSLLPPKGGVGA